LERALEADPFDEDAFRQLLANLHAAGRSAEALRRYARLEKLVREELDTAPSPATRSLAESIRQAADAAPFAVAIAAALPNLPAPAVLPLTGYEPKREMAPAAAHAAADGVGRVVLRVGEHGVGKTRLSQKIAQRLHERAS
jgi:DNA-binding SARP family transcriptional activator